MNGDESRLISDFYELKVEQLMDKRIWDLPLLEKNAPVENVLAILEGKSHVWVVNNLDEKKLVGVITRQDVLHILIPPKRYYNVFSVPRIYQHGTKGKAEDVMTRNPITCTADEKIVDVLQKMIRHQVRRIAVLLDKGIIGEISLKHLIHKYYRASQYHSILDEEGFSD
jgi:predicted transcriptional regulator